MFTAFSQICWNTGRVAILSVLLANLHAALIYKCIHAFYCHLFVLLMWLLHFIFYYWHCMFTDGTASFYVLCLCGFCFFCFCFFMIDWNYKSGINSKLQNDTMIIVKFKWKLRLVPDADLCLDLCHSETQQCGNESSYCFPTLWNRTPASQ